MPVPVPALFRSHAFCFGYAYPRSEPAHGPDHAPGRTGRFREPARVDRSGPLGLGLLSTLPTSYWEILACVRRWISVRLLHVRGGADARASEPGPRFPRSRLHLPRATTRGRLDGNQAVRSPAGRDPGRAV